jgi:hypothetical protein
MAQLCAMFTTRRQLQRREQTVQISDWAAGYNGKCAVELGFKIWQQGKQ